MSSLIRTSGHLMIEGDYASRNHRDLTSISIENLSFIFQKYDKSVIHELKKVKRKISFSVNKDNSRF